MFHEGDYKPKNEIWQKLLIKWEILLAQNEKSPELAWPQLKSKKKPGVVYSGLYRIMRRVEVDRGQKWPL